MHMKEEKSFAYTMILGVCLLLSLVMIGRMLLGRPASGKLPEQPEGEEDMEIQITETMIAERIRQALPFSPDELTATISETGTVSVHAEIQKEKLQELGLASGNLRTALLFLPEHCDITAAWQPTVQNGAFQLDCTEAKLAGFSVPEQAAAELTNLLADAISNMLAEQQLTLKDIRCEDGILFFITEQ